MEKRIAVDFGTSHTVIAEWSEDSGTVRTIAMEDISIEYLAPIKGRKNHWKNVNLIPSLIRITDESFQLGGEVEKNYDPSKDIAVFRNMKRYIAAGKKITRNINGRKVDFHEAGSMFLGEIIRRSEHLLGPSKAEYVFTVPSEYFENYTAWIGDVCAENGISEWRIMDEATACAVGYGGENGEVVMIFDFGGGTLDVAIARVLDVAAKDGRGSVVLGKSGCELGGIDIDAWIMDEFLRQNDLDLDEIRDLSVLLMKEAERVKIELSFENESRMILNDYETGKTYSMVIDREDLTDILDKNYLFDTLKSQIGKAMEEALEKGIVDEDIDRVCIVGGSGLIPAVKDFLVEIFGRRVSFFASFEAVSHGAAASGVHVEDHIQHDYALRYWDPRRKERGLKIFIPSGTGFPADNVANFKLAPSWKGQKEIELAVFEVGDGDYRNSGMEIVFGTDGRIILEPSSFKSSELPLNADNPTFIHLDPPGMDVSVERVDVRFDIDNRKMLLVSVQDRLTGRVLRNREPVLKLK